MKVLEDKSIIFATSNSGIRVIDSKEYSVISNILLEELDQTTSLLFLSNDAKIVALLNDNKVYIISLLTQTVLKRIAIANEMIEIIGIDPSSNYLLVGTNKGRVLQYKINSNVQLSRLCSFPYLLPDEKFSQKEQNYVSSFAFHNDMFACSGYGGAIYVINLYSRDNTKVINRSRSKIETLYFLDDKHLISGNMDGVIEVISLDNISKIKRINAPFLHIKNIIAMPNKDYILVSSHKNYISLINIKTLKIIDDRYLEFDLAVDTIVQKDEESLLVTLKDATVVNVELLNLDRLQSLVNNNKLYEAYTLLQTTPILKGSKEYLFLEKAFHKNVKKAIRYLLDGDINSAQEITRPLMQISSKKAEIELIYKAFKYYETFQLLFHEKKYSLVYSMSERYPALKETKEYKSVENFWKRDFVEAQKQMLLNNTEAAKALLRDYIMIPSKRSIIKFILYSNKDFIGFLQAVEEREFSKLNEILKENKNFANLDHYQSLNKEIQESVYTAQELLAIGNVDHAEIIIQRLEKISQYEKKALELKEASQKIKELYTAFNDDKLFLCYKLIDANSSLKETDLGKHLQDKWNKDIKSWERYAIKGQVQKLLDDLGELKNLQSRSPKIGDLLRVGYRMQIIHNINQSKYKEAKKLIIFYLNYFGYDIEIEHVISLYTKQSSSKISLTRMQLRRKPRDFWLYAQLQQ